MHRVTGRQVCGAPVAALMQTGELPIPSHAMYSQALPRPPRTPMKPTKKTAALDLKLSDFLCFAVYSSNLAFGKAYKPMLERLGLTYTQYITLVALWEEDNQTVGSLGEKLFLESNTLTPILKKLEGMGYVLRQRDPEDERQVRINLTKEGRKLREGLSEDGFPQTGLDPDDFVQMQQAIVKLRNHLIRTTKDRE
jgi:DNA-binding MarR family transcriptional regulator